MIRLNPNLVPADGLQYTNPDGVAITAPDFRQLVAVVTEYRRLGNLPRGNPELEITEQLCKAHPRLCIRETSRTRLARVQDYIETVLTEKAANRLRRVEADEQLQRAKICSACRFNVNWDKKCPPCGKKLFSRMACLRPYDPLKGQTCSQVGDELSVAVTLRNQDQSTLVPTECWRHKK